MSVNFKRVFEAAKLAYAAKTKESITYQKLGSHDFGEMPIVLSTKVNLLPAIPPLLNGPEVLSSASDKAKLLKTFLRTLILMTQVSLYPFSTNLKLDSISVTPTWLRR